MAQAKPKNVPAYFVSDITQLPKTHHKIVNTADRIWAGHFPGECGSAPCCHFQVQLSSTLYYATSHTKSIPKLNLRLTIELQNYYSIESNNASFPGSHHILF